MSVQPIIPPEWAWAYDIAVGQTWPEADEDAVRRVAQAWTDALRGLVAIADGGNTAAQNVNYSVQAVSSDEFNKYWSRYVDGDDSAVGQMARQCEILAQELLAFAEQTEFTKLSININLVILFIQLVFDAAMAIVTAGASTAEGIVAAFVTRMTVRNLLMELLKAVVMAVLPDVITQAIMLADGHRGSFDVGETLQAAQMGAVGGLIGMGVGKGLGKLGVSEFLEHGAGKLIGGGVNAAISGAATNVLTNTATGGLDQVENQIHAALDPEYAKELAEDQRGQGAADQKAGQNPLIAALNGAFTGALFHGAHETGGALSDRTFRPETYTTTDPDTGEVTTVKAIPVRDGTGTNYAVFDDNHNLLGNGTLDGNQLTVTPHHKSAQPFTTTKVPDTAETTHPAEQDPASPPTEPGSGTDQPATAPASTTTTPSGNETHLASVEEPQHPATGTDTGTAANQPAPDTTSATGAGQPATSVAPPESAAQRESLAEPTPEPTPASTPAPASEPMSPSNQAVGPERGPASPLTVERVPRAEQTTVPASGAPATEVATGGPTVTPPSGQNSVSLAGAHASPEPANAPATQTATPAVEPLSASEPRPGTPTDPSAAQQLAPQAASPDSRPTEAGGFGNGRSGNRGPGNGRPGTTTEGGRSPEPWQKARRITSKLEGRGTSPDPAALERDPVLKDLMAQYRATTDKDTRRAVDQRIAEHLGLEANRPGPSAQEVAAGLDRMGAWLVESEPALQEANRKANDLLRQVPQHAKEFGVSAAAYVDVPGFKEAYAAHYSEEARALLGMDDGQGFGHDVLTGDEFGFWAHSGGESPQEVPSAVASDGRGGFNDRYDPAWGDLLPHNQLKNAHELGMIETDDRIGSHQDALRSDVRDALLRWKPELEHHPLFEGLVDELAGHDPSPGQAHASPEQGNTSPGEGNTSAGQVNRSLPQNLPIAERPRRQQLAHEIGLNDRVWRKNVVPHLEAARGFKAEAIMRRAESALREAVPVRMTELSPAELRGTLRSLAEVLQKRGNHHRIVAEGAEILTGEPLGLDLEAARALAADLRNRSAAVPHSAGRDVDAEAKLLAQTLQVLRGMGDPAAVNGTIVIAPDKEMCLSCQDLVARVQAEYPNVRMVIGGTGADAPTRLTETPGFVENPPAGGYISKESLVNLPDGYGDNHESPVSPDQPPRPSESPNSLESPSQSPADPEPSASSQAPATAEEPEPTAPVTSPTSPEENTHFASLGALQDAPEAGASGHGVSKVPEEAGPKITQPLSPLPSDHAEPHDGAGLALGGATTETATHPAYSDVHESQASDSHLVLEVTGEGKDPVLLHVHRTDSGYVLVRDGADAELHSSAAAMPAEPGFVNVVGHAVKDGFLVGDHVIPFSDVIDRLGAATAGNNDVLRLISCEAGGGEAAAELARATGRQVVAADRPVWITKSGEVVTSAPVDAGKNWYPRRPPDGLWKVFTPGGDVITPEAGDPRLPRPPRGWAAQTPRPPAEPEGGHGNAPRAPDPSGEQFKALGPERKGLFTFNRKGGRWELSDEWKHSYTYVDVATGQVQNGFYASDEAVSRRKAGYDYTAAPDRLTLAAQPLADRLGSDFLDNYRAAVTEMKARGRLLHLSEMVDLQRTNSLGQPGRAARPVAHLLEEIFGVSENPAAAHGMRRRDEETIDVAGIPVHDKWPFGSQPTQQWTDFKGTAHGGGKPKGGSYVALLDAYDDHRLNLRDAILAQQPQFSGERAGRLADRAFALALHDMLSQDTPQARRYRLETLAHTIDPGFRVGATGWEQRPGAPLCKFGATLAHLIGHIEPGRDLRALTNLMALDLAARGEISMRDAIRHFNVLSPPRAAVLTRVENTAQAGDTPEITIARVPEKLLGNVSPENLQKDLPVYRERQSQVLAAYALSVVDGLQDNPAVVNSFAADKVDHLRSHPEILIEALLSAYGVTQ